MPEMQIELIIFVWSPDGKKIYTENEVFPNFELQARNLDPSIATNSLPNKHHSLHSLVKSLNTPLSAFLLSLPLICYCFKVGL